MTMFDDKSKGKRALQVSIGNTALDNELLYNDSWYCKTTISLA
jgi:hypothetical protein